MQYHSVEFHVFKDLLSSKAIVMMKPRSLPFNLILGSDEKLRPGEVYMKESAPSAMLSVNENNIITLFYHQPKLIYQLRLS